MPSPWTCGPTLSRLAGEGRTDNGDGGGQVQSIMLVSFGVF